MSIEDETASKTGIARPLSVQDKIDIEGRCIDFGSQLGRFWGFNSGLTYSILNYSFEEPLHAAVRMTISIPVGMTVGLLVGGFAGVLASQIYLSRRS